MFSASIIRSDDVSAHYFLDSPLKERHCVVKQVFKSYAQQMKGAATLSRFLNACRGIRASRTI